MTPKGSRLRWFKFWPDDFIGGVVTGGLSAPDTGCFLLLLCAQWATKGRQCIPSDAPSLARICLGEQPSDAVLGKFVPVRGRPKYLMNERLAKEWEAATREHAGKQKGGGKHPDTGRKATTNRGRSQKPELRSQKPEARRKRSEEKSGSLRESSAARRVTWTNQACDDWTERYGAGSVGEKGGQIGAGLKPVVDANGWDVVRPAWRRYLAETTHPSPSAQNFASHFGDWTGNGKGSKRKQSTQFSGIKAWMEEQDEPKGIRSGDGDDGSGPGDRAVEGADRRLPRGPDQPGAADERSGVRGRSGEGDPDH